MYAALLQASLPGKLASQSSPASFLVLGCGRDRNTSAHCVLRKLNVRSCSRRCAVSLAGMLHHAGLLVMGCGKHMQRVPDAAQGATHINLTQAHAARAGRAAQGAGLPAAHDSCILSHGMVRRCVDAGRQQAHAGLAERAAQGGPLTPEPWHMQRVQVALRGR